MRRQGEGGKLTQAARLFARGAFHRDEQADETEDELEAAKRMFGIVIQEADEGENPAQAEAVAEPVFYLLPENEAAWRLWLRVQTQWRIGPAGYPTGLSYSGVLARIGRVGPRRQARLFDEIQVMERAALYEFASQRERKSSQRGA